jgi:hypothetical protein
LQSNLQVLFLFCGDGGQLGIKVDLRINPDDPLQVPSTFTDIHAVLVARYYICTLTFTANSSDLLCRGVLIERAASD